MPDKEKKAGREYSFLEERLIFWSARPGYPGGNPEPEICRVPDFKGNVPAVQSLRLCVLE